MVWECPVRVKAPQQMGRANRHLLGQIAASCQQLKEIQPVPGVNTARVKRSRGRVASPAFLFCSSQWNKPVPTPDGQTQNTAHRADGGFLQRCTCA